MRWSRLHGPTQRRNLPTIWLKQKASLSFDVRGLTLGLLLLVLGSSGFAGCIGSPTNDGDYGLVVTYETTNVTIVEHWEEGELVSTEYPVLMFDFSGSMLPGKAIMHTVEGTHASGTVDASTSSLVEVQFEHHGLHLLELTTDYEGSTAGESKTEAYPERVVVRVEKRIEWLETSTSDPVPMVLDSINEAGEEPASALVIESTVSNPALITNVGGGQEVDITWGLIDGAEQACQSHQGTVGDGDAVTWKTVHFNTYEAHELRVVYEDGQDLVDVEQTVSIQYEHLETKPNA